MVGGGEDGGVEGGGEGLHNGLAVLAGRSERLETVHRVGVCCGVVEMVPASPPPFAQRMSFCIAPCDSAVC